MLMPNKAAVGWPGIVGEDRKCADERLGERLARQDLSLSVRIPRCSVWGHEDLALMREVFVGHDSVRLDLERSPILALDADRPVVDLPFLPPRRGLPARVPCPISERAGLPEVPGLRENEVRRYPRVP